MLLKVVFVGLPGCGKTTVSRLVAERLGFTWQDTDRDIEAVEGRSIADIFASSGEPYFRKVETEHIRKLLLSGRNVVISAGGGAVVYNEKLLAENAVVVYLRRAISDIMTTLKAGSRPLVTSEDDLRALYDARHEIYERAAAITVDNDGKIGAAVEKTIDALKGLMMK